MVSAGFSLQEIGDMTAAQIDAYFGAIRSEQKRSAKDSLILMRAAQSSKQLFKETLKELS